jgi:hypothetical protein
METRLFIILSILAFNFGISFANTETAYSESRPVERTAVYLAPVTPFEAEFSDLLPEADASVALLTPVTPKEATFEEEGSSELTVAEPGFDILAPVAPIEAGFEEII